MKATILYSFYMNGSSYKDDDYLMNIGAFSLHMERVMDYKKRFILKYKRAPSERQIRFIHRYLMQFKGEFVEITKKLLTIVAERL